MRQEESLSHVCYSFAPASLSLQLPLFLANNPPFEAVLKGDGILRSDILLDSPAISREKAEQDEKQAALGDARNWILHSLPNQITKDLPWQLHCDLSCQPGY